MKVFDTLDALVQAKGQTVGPGGWVVIDQAMIDDFARVTRDLQWIHVDRERAAQGPFGTTIAHGFLTVSLIPHLMAEMFSVRQPNTGVNYGLNKVRFMSPVPSGSRVRADATLMEATPVDGGGVQFLWQVRVEIEGREKPACIAEWIVRRYPADA